MRTHLVALATLAVGQDIFLHKPSVETVHAEYLGGMTRSSHVAAFKDMCDDPRVNQGSKVIVTETLYSYDITPNTVEAVQCCSGICKCTFQDSNMQCQFPYDDVLVVQLKNHSAAIGGSAKQSNWTGYSSACCGCSNSGSGVLGGVPGQAIVFPLEFAPLMAGNVTEEGLCSWDPFSGPPCV